MAARYEIFACSDYTPQQTVLSLHDLARSQSCLNIHKSINKYTQQSMQKIAPLRIHHNFSTPKLETFITNQDLVMFST